MTENLVDSCGWLEYFADDSNADFYAPAIEDTENLVVPSLCLTEVFKKLLKERDESIAWLAISAMRKGNIVDLDADIALEAAKIGLIYKLPIADSIIYATAKKRNALIWTQDKHFAEFSDVKYTSK